MSQGVDQSSIEVAKGTGNRTIDAKSRATARKAAQEFEAMFISMMLKEMRSTTPPDNLTGGGRGEEVFRSLLDQEYASAIASQKGIGIAKVIEKQLLDSMNRGYAGSGKFPSAHGTSIKED